MPTPPSLARSVAAFAFLVLCSACSEQTPAVLASADGRYRVVFVGEGNGQEQAGREQMTAALARVPQIDLVFAHSGAMARGAALAARERQREGVRFVGIDARPLAGRRDAQDKLLVATIEHPGCAATALDLAVLACAKVPLPREIAIGTRVFTADAPEGRAIPSPGDVVLMLLRNEHKARLQPVPEEPQVRIGVATCDADEARRTALREAMQAWANGHPAVALDYRDAASDPSQQPTMVEELVRAGCHAVVVTPADPLWIAPACKAALQQGVHVVALGGRLGTDDCTCFVGADEETLGRAAADVTRQLLPQGGSIALIQGPMSSGPAPERHRGFVDCLGLQPPPGR